MTRDQKLALIVGFSVVLLVGVLISDHFSRARQARVSGITPSEPVRLASSGRAATAEPIVREQPWPSATIELKSPAPSRSLLWPETAVPVTMASGSSANESAASERVRATGAERQGLESGLRVEGQERPVMEDASARAAALANSMSSGGSTSSAQGSSALTGEGGMGELGTGEGLLTEIKAKGGEIQTDETGTTFTLRQDRKPASDRVKSDVLAAEQGSQALAGVVAGADRTLEVGMVREHTVASGETMVQIAERYYKNGSVWKSLAAFNKSVVKSDGTVRIGARLRIPPIEDLGTVVARPMQPSPRSRPGSPVMTGPKSLGTLAEGKKDAKLKVGAEDKIEPKPVVKTASKASRPKTYTVRKGDTLGAIAARVLGSSKRAGELLQANEDKLEDEDTLEAGMVLRVPQA
jgi:nucleoid-associated protein YgaU